MPICHIMDVAQSYKELIQYYFQDSLKEHTWRWRKVGTMFEFSDDTPFPVNFRYDFLQNSQNKMMLNYCGDKVFNVAYWNSVLSYTEVDQRSGILFCTSWGRLVRHSRDAFSQEYQTVVVKAIDTDVLILLLSFVFDSTILPNGKVHAAMVMRLGMPLIKIK